MSSSVPQFKPLCPELTEREHQIISNYCSIYCPVGEAQYYENYFYRLYWFAKKSKAKKVVELGCTPGGSSIALMYAMQRAKGHLWSCDVVPISNREIAFAAHDVPAEYTKRQTHVLSTAEDYGHVWKKQNMGLVDLIYLDALHTYEDTMAEIKAWIPNLREGGLFVFHDTAACPTVLESIYDSIISGACGPYSFEFHTFPDCHGHGVLQWFNLDKVSTLKEDSSIVSLTSMLLSK